MKFRRCKLCVETNTRPSSQFDEEGVCPACRNVSKQANETIDWEKRYEKLAEIVNWARSKNVSGYDCIIGVSGGKDSTRQALHARSVGLKPLLVCCTYPPEQQTSRGVRNLENLISLGFDTITVTPAPGTSKAMMKNCLEKYGNIFNATELALYASLPITAIAYNIPMILLGENPGLAWGNSVGSDSYIGNQMRHMHTLKGGDPSLFAPPSVGEDELYWYRFPHEGILERAGVNIVYLGYFMPDFNDHTNAEVSIAHGLEIRTGEDADPENTGGIYPFTALDDDFVLVNQMLKYLKFGFGKTTQEVGSAIRHGRMSREEGMRLVKMYDGKCSEKYIQELCDYLDVSIEEFWKIVEPHVNRELFEKDRAGNWKLKHEIE